MHQATAAVLDKLGKAYVLDQGQMRPPAYIYMAFKGGANLIIFTHNIWIRA